MNAATEMLKVTTPEIPAGTPLRLRAAAPSLWRVLDRRGLVIGHLQAVARPGGTRYRARIFQSSSRAFLELGEFWSANDALDCLRFAR